MKTTLPTDSAERKNYPLADGCLDYFPAALAGVARVSYEGNRKHNGDAPLHHARGKSGDHANCVMRHLVDVNGLRAAIRRGEPGSLHSSVLLHEANQLAWRALALSQELHEQYGGAPLAPGARLPEVAPNGVGFEKPTGDDVRVALIDYSHEIPLIDDRPPIHCPAGADWRERGIARDDHGGNACVPR